MPKPKSTNPEVESAFEHLAAKPSAAYKTANGVMYYGRSEDVLESPLTSDLKGNVDLIFTSPPFPLHRKKKYDNLQGDAYIQWLKGFAKTFRSLLKPTGSIVMEVGNSWEPGKPVMSTLALESLLAFLREGELNLCQQFVWHNPARLPSPAQWVTVERIRLKDSYTHLWWMAPSERPKADNRRVLTEYSKSMQTLLKKKSYNSGHRPSEHKIGEKSFLTNNGGSIPPSLLKYEHEVDLREEASSVVTLANTQAGTDYQVYCREHSLETHPARMPVALAEFFIKFLTDEGDTVVDPFAGSNTTGSAAEKLNRRWASIELNEAYIEGSKGRFESIAKTRPSQRKKGKGAGG